MDAREPRQRQITEQDIQGLEDKLQSLAGTLPQGEQDALAQLLALAARGYEAMEQGEVQPFAQVSPRSILQSRGGALSRNALNLRTVLRAGWACGAGTSCKGR